MNSNSQTGPPQGGLWNTARPPISTETQNLLKVMMQESKLTNFQTRKLTESLKKSQSLPTKVGPSFTVVEKKPKPAKKESKIVDPRTYKNGVRSFDVIVESGAYEKSDYKPTMKKSITDQDKDRLARIMHLGKEAEMMKQCRPIEEDADDDYEEPEIDRFDELKAEIQERSEFLETMTKLGKRKQYETIILTEISQKIREMEIIDKSRTAELNELKKLKNSI